MTGVTDILDGIEITNTNDITNQFADSNITAADTLPMLDFLVGAVYNSTANKDSTPYACEVSGLAKLNCPETVLKNPQPNGEPIRAVGLAGLFVPAPWATGGEDLTLEQASTFYTADDFEKMKSVGINTVQIAVPTALFTPNDVYGANAKIVLEKVLKLVEGAGLQAILGMVSTGDELDAVLSAAKFGSESDVVLGIAIPKGMEIDMITVVAGIRAQAPEIPIFIPVNEGDLVKINGEFDENVYAALELSHSSTVGDIASSTSLEDRSKMFYHEATACITRSPLEYTACFRQMPVFLSSGFDLSIDNCIDQGIDGAFKDFGQCDRFNETTDSGWWHRHRSSFAARQLYAYERGLGWSFATWKLYENDAVGVIDSPAKLLALEDVVEAGIFPSINGTVPAATACLNPPEPDFVLGDETLAPSLGPPPDCGDGWWNYTSEQCDYWIPPPPAPTPAPCPVCEECKSFTINRPFLASGGALILGAILGSLVTAVSMKLFGANKRHQYSPIPN